MFALKVRHNARKEENLMLLVIALILSVVLGITTLISLQLVKNEKAEKAAMTEAAEKAKSELEAEKAANGKLNRELDAARKENAELHNKLKTVTAELQTSISAIGTIEEAKKAVERETAKAAEARQEAADAKKAAEEARQKSQEADTKIERANGELKSIEDKIQCKAEELRSLSELYRAVADKAEDSAALEAKSGAIVQQVQKTRKAIEIEDELWYRFTTDPPTDVAAILLAYDGDNNLISGAIVSYNYSPICRRPHLYRLWCEAEANAKVDLQKDLTGAAKIICFAPAGRVAIRGEKIVFLRTDSDVDITVGDAKVVTIDLDDKKVANLIGLNAQDGQKEQIQALQAEHEKLQQQIFEITQSELVNPAADYLAHK